MTQAEQVEWIAAKGTMTYALGFICSFCFNQFFSPPFSNWARWRQQVICISHLKNWSFNDVILGWHLTSFFTVIKKNDLFVLSNVKQILCGPLIQLTLKPQVTRKYIYFFFQIDMNISSNKHLLLPLRQSLFISLL